MQEAQGCNSDLGGEDRELGDDRDINDATDATKEQGRAAKSRNALQPRAYISKSYSQSYLQEKVLPETIQGR